jgi:hypothetical protein
MAFCAPKVTPKKQGWEGYSRRKQISILAVIVYGDESPISGSKSGRLPGKFGIPESSARRLRDPIGIKIFWP